LPLSLERLHDTHRNETVHNNTHNSCKTHYYRITHTHIERKRERERDRERERETKQSPPGHFMHWDLGHFIWVQHQLKIKS
jgi:hypothetical protein